MFFQVISKVGFLPLCPKTLECVLNPSPQNWCVRIMRRQQQTSSSLPSEQSHCPLHTVAQSQQKAEKNINSDLILLGVLILVYYTVSGWVLKRKQLQPSFSCYFRLCRTCPTPVQWGRKPSCHCTPSLHVREDEKTAQVPSSSRQMPTRYFGTSFVLQISTYPYSSGSHSSRRT